jgi:multidrug resistance efflux pump
MKKLTISLSLISLLFLASCGKADDIVVQKEIKKTPLLIETQIVWKKTESFSVEKSARLVGGSSLILAAEWVGEVSNISVKEWSKIKRGTRLISLRDTVNAYDLRVAQAQNGVSIQDAGIASTRVNLDRAIIDTEIAYEQAKRSYDTLLSKTRLSYDTIVNSNQKTLDTLEATYKTYLADIDRNLDQVIYESDRILGLSSNNEYINDWFESQLGARVGNLKYTSDNSYGRALAQLGQIRAQKLKTLTPESAKADIENIELGYTLLQKHLDDMIYMIQNNVITGELTMERNAGWLAQFNGFRAWANGNNAGFVQWKVQTLTFLKNYKLNELATKVAVESLDRKLTIEEEALIQSSSDARLLYSTTIIDLKDRIASAKLWLRQAQNARDTATKSRDTTLAQLGASRVGWVISLEQAQREYAKLTITAPFDGSVTKVIATPGQRVNPGTPMIEIVSNTPEVVIDLDAEIALSLALSDTVKVKVWEKIFEGFIIALSRSAWENLLYTTRISVPDATGLLGSAATIIFTSSREVTSSGSLSDLVLPLRSIKIISEREWEIAILGSGNTLTYKTVRLWNIVGEWVRIEDALDPKIEIILSDVSNYDKEKFFLEKKSRK